MASTARTTIRRRLGVLIAGAVVRTALSAAAGAAAPAPMGGQAAGLARLGAEARPRSPTPGFLLQRGRYARIDAPGRSDTDAWGINDRGQIVLPEPGNGLAAVAT
jgi:hypothetical protein